MEIVGEDVDQFIGSSARAADLMVLDGVIRAALPGMSRVLWRGPMWGGTDQSIVGYGTIVQPRPRGADVEWFLVGLAEQKRYLSVYVNAAEKGEYLVRSFASRLGTVKVGAAALSFDAVDRIDLEVLGELVRRAGELNPAAT